MSEEARPADRAVDLPDPDGDNYYFHDSPDLSNAGDGDIMVYKRFLYTQKADFSAQTHPSEHSRRLFLLDQPIIDYLEEAMVRRPD